MERFTPPPSTPAARLKGGLSTLITALEKKLILGTIKLNSPVISLKAVDRDIAVHTKEKNYVADIVINTLPPRVAIDTIHYQPPLPTALHQKLSETPTWMGYATKCVIVFERDFWREDGLSGFCFSHVGPLSELHDASTQEQAALFGFFHTRVQHKSEAAVREQIIRLFGNKASPILNIYIVDWSQERYTTTTADKRAPSNYPHYGYTLMAYNERVHFCGSESSINEGGYLEGAIRAVQTLCSRL